MEIDYDVLHVRYNTLFKIGDLVTIVPYKNGEHRFDYGQTVIITENCTDEIEEAYEAQSLVANAHGNKRTGYVYKEDLIPFVPAKEVVVDGN